MTLRPLLIACLLLGAVCSLAARADENAIGYVKTTTGEASVTHGNHRVAAQVGTPLYAGCELQTGAHGSLGVSFKDNTVMSIGPDTALTVDEYLYAPEQGSFKLVARLLRGSLNYVSGLIAKLQPDAVSVKTPSGIIGVRGTQFAVKVQAPAP